MIIKDKKGHKWEVYAITDSWYHLKDDMGNMSIINFRNIELHFKVVEK